MQLKAYIHRGLETRKVGGKRQDSGGIRLVWGLFFPLTQLITIRNHKQGIPDPSNMIFHDSRGFLFSEKDLFSFILTDTLFYLEQISVSLLTSHPHFLSSLKYI